MAHAGSRDWSHNHSDDTPCDRCKAPYSDHHQWYYPTFMNGDAEQEQALCAGCWELKAAEKRFNELPYTQKMILVDIIKDWGTPSAEKQKKANEIPDVDF